MIHSFQVEDEVKKRFAKSVEDVEKRRYEGRRYQNPYGILTLLLTYLILSIQLVVSAYLVFIGSISERMLLSIFYLISSVNNPIREIAYLLLDVKAAIPNARKVDEVKKRFAKSVEDVEKRRIGKISHAVGVERGTIWLHESKRGLTWGEYVL